jgi:peptide/nickel transport system ATP-binding protein
MSSGKSNNLIDMEPETVSKTDSKPLLEVSNLKKHFRESEGVLDNLLGSVDHVHAVDGVNLTIRKGETFAVVGESGCGKSTLAHTCLNLHEPTDGLVIFKGSDITGLSQQKMRPYRRQMQIIFQNPLASLNPRRTVGSILRAPMKIHDIGENKSDRIKRAEDLLEEVGLKGSYHNRYPHQFSGGEQQRIALARALAVEPDLLVADEPVSALDVSVQSQILNLLNDLREKYNLSMLFIAHDLSVVRHIADRVAVMYLGEIVETAPVDELFEKPNHPYTKSLLSAIPRINPKKRGDQIILRGTVPSPMNPPDGCRFHTRCPAIIPPDDWSASQEIFRQAFTFRTRVEEDRIEPESIRTRLKSEDAETTDEAVVNRIIENELPVKITELPAKTADKIHKVARLMVEDERDAAVEQIINTLPSQCVNEKPEFIVSNDRKAACHRIDSE